ncbi:hypothetical protein LCM20_08655 [Halobacillus litoralis]|uniref:hypothetical protein n=1 Tax=Halobacillus litoralis TaxID=45668 RepID=UPI001CD6A685|nr:hypothetical protein [Halobacillus litoralis]MCA0970655.1 hypothetical protein [Halobacillus litoralis]
MRVKERHFPYPVLADFSDDYKKGSYETEISYDVTKDEFILRVKHSLDSKELYSDILRGRAMFCVHIECSKTQMRILSKSKEEKQEVKVKASDIDQRIDVCTFVIANEDIKGFSNESFDDDYKGYTFEVSKGDILAIGDDYLINIEKDKSNDSESILQLEKSLEDNPKENFSLTFATDRIVVTLNQEDYKTYNELANTEQLLPILHALIGVPALSAALQLISQEMSDANEDEYSSYRWYRVLMEKIEYLGLDPYDEKVYEEPIQLAQKILDNPLSKSLLSLSNIYEGLYDGMEDDDEDI